MDPLHETVAPGGESTVGSVIGDLLPQRFLDQPSGYLLVGAFDREVRDWLGAETWVVHLTEKIMRKQKGQWRKQKRGGGKQYHGHELTVAEYRLLPRILAQPQLVMRYMPSRRISGERLALRLNLISEHNGIYYNLVIGRLPDDPATVRVISFHQLDNGRSQLDSMIRRAETGDYGQGVFRNSLDAPK